MPIDILMPALSPTMEKGNLAKWMVKEGDSVKSGDVIAEIETDKATMEVEAVDEGVVARILIPEGSADVAVNTPIALLAAEGEDVKSIKAAPKAAPSSAKPVALAPPPPSPVTPAATTPAPASTSSPQQQGKARIFASPLARRIATEKGIDLLGIKGSGPHGRIIMRDVVDAKPSAAAPKTETHAAAPIAGMADDAVLKLFEPGSYALVPHDNMRRTIARRLLQAKQTIPHFYLTVDVTLDALLKLRAELNDAAPVHDGKAAYKLSVNDMLIKALALALKVVPDANVSWAETGMLRHMHADVGVAVSIPGGLITPVIRKAEEKPLSTISNEMKDFASRARARKLKPEEYQGGTTSLSNLGMFGIKDFAAIINPPHATILAVGAGEKRPVVKDDALAIATMMSATLSTDHRAVDGALGAQLMEAFRAFVEKPLSMLV